MITRTGPIYFIGLETLPSTSNRLSDESSMPFYSSSSGSHNIFFKYQLMLIYHLKKCFYFTLLSFFESKDIFFGYWPSSPVAPFFWATKLDQETKRENAIVESLNYQTPDTLCQIYNKLKFHCTAINAAHTTDDSATAPSGW